MDPASGCRQLERLCDTEADVVCGCSSVVNWKQELNLPKHLSHHQLHPLSSRIRRRFRDRELVCLVKFYCSVMGRDLVIHFDYRHRRDVEDGGGLGVELW